MNASKHIRAIEATVTVIIAGWSLVFVANYVLDGTGAGSPNDAQAVYAHAKQAPQIAAVSPAGLTLSDSAAVVQPVPSAKRTSEQNTAKREAKEATTAGEVEADSPPTDESASKNTNANEATETPADKSGSAWKRKTGKPIASSQVVAISRVPHNLKD